MNLTPSQSKALDLSRNIAVTASAGSGKTSVLVERYVRILDENPGLGVENILAITFTNKAAAEMRERVRRAVLERIHERPDEEARWVQVRDGLPAAHISTIHAFCSSVLRQHPVEAGVDPLFEMLDDADRVAALDEAVDSALQALADLPEDEPRRKALRALLGQFGRYRLRSILADLIERRDAIGSCFDQIRGKDEQEIGEWVADLVGSYRQRMLDAFVHGGEMQGLIDELQTLAPQGANALSPSVKPNEARLNVLAAWQALTTERDTERQMVALADMQDFNLRGGSKKQWDEGVLARCKQVLKIIKERAAGVTKSCPAPSPADECAPAILRALCLLHDGCLDAYRQAKGLAAQLDYSDLEELACGLLRDNVGGARDHYREQFAFVLVDEFQDTNHHQWQIIAQLVEGARHKLFVVGDPKQSIYGFRGAEVEVFEEVKRAAVMGANREHELDRVQFGDGAGSERERLGDITMAENFRSRPAVVGFVNALFAGLMAEGGDRWAPPYDRLRAASNDPEPGQVELLLAYQPDEEDGPGPEQTEAQLLSARLSALVTEEQFRVYDKGSGEHRAAEFGDVVILLRKRRPARVAAIEDALREYGVPFEVVDGTGFYQRQEVRDVTNALRFLANQRNDIALAGVLRSPLFGLSDVALFLVSQARGDHLFGRLRWALADDSKEAKALRRELGDEQRVLEFAGDTLQRWLSVAHRLPSSELIRRIMEETGVWGVVASGPRGDQDRANIEKLILKAQEFHGRGLASLADLAERLDQLMDAGTREGEAAEEEGDRGVRIMTVHAAKGLEAPIVVVADLSAGFNFDTQRAIYFDREWGLGISAPNPQENYKTEPTALRKAIGDIQRAKTIAEEKRLFYVACTRARDRLLLCGSLPDSRRESWAAWLVDALDIEAGQETITFEEEGRSYDIPIHSSPAAFPHPAQPTHGEPLYLEAERTLGAPASDRPLAFQSALDPLPTPDSERRFSPTELMLFKQCPLRHYFCYEVGIPEETAALDEPEAVWSHHDARAAAIARGNAAHRMFERLTPQEPSCDTELAESVLNEFEGLSKAQREKLLADLTQMASAFRESEFGATVLNAPDCRNEASFSLRLAAGRIEGQIDKLYKTANGSWAILDYKTNSIKSSEKDGTASKYELQMQVYALAACRLLPEPIDKIEAQLYFTELNNRASFHFTQHDLNAIEQDLQALMSEIDAFDPARGSHQCPACEGCGYRDLAVCESVRRSAP